MNPWSAGCSRSRGACRLADLRLAGSRLAFTVIVFWLLLQFNAHRAGDARSRPLAGRARRQRGDAERQARIRHADAGRAAHDEEPRAQSRRRARDLRVDRRGRRDGARAAATAAASRAGRSSGRRTASSFHSLAHDAHGTRRQRSCAPLLVKSPALAAFLEGARHVDGRPRRQDLDGRRAGRLARRQDPRADPHAALRLRRLRRRARLQHGRRHRDLPPAASTPSACSTAPRSCA